MTGVFTIKLKVCNVIQINCQLQQSTVEPSVHGNLNNKDTSPVMSLKIAQILGDCP